MSLVIMHHKVGHTLTACGLHDRPMTDRRKRVTCQNCLKATNSPRLPTPENGLGILLCRVCNRPYRDHKSMNEHL